MPADKEFHRSANRSRHSRSKSPQARRSRDSRPNEEPEIAKEKPCFELSGTLAEETNRYNGVVVKYNEPPEARKPSKHWRLYVFRDGVQIDMFQVHRQSAYLLGRERKIADIPIDNPSCSKQHAVLQYRSVASEKSGHQIKVVRPYLIDLGSVNGTFINNERIESERYIELFHNDMIKFGTSPREYIFLQTELAEKAARVDNK